MTKPGETTHPPGAGRAYEDTKPPTPTGKAWLPAVLALLGSSGVISVFGPITGELWWEGYLAAFGLTPEEFPASPSRIRVYAYNAIVEGIASIYLNLKAFVPYILGAVLLVLMLAVAFDHFKSRRGVVERSVGRVVDAVRAGGRWGLALRLLSVSLVGTISLLVVLYVALTLVVLIISPTEARRLGVRQGQKELAHFVAKQQEAGKCDSVESPDFKASCPTVVAYSDKALAVFSGGRIYRLARDAAKVTSSAPAATAVGTASAASTSPGHSESHVKRD